MMKIEEIKFIHDDENLPMIPGALFAKAKDGSVELSWKNDPRSGGYVIYYGFSSGIYFCEDALQGASPLDVGHSLDSDASSISTSQSTTNRITLNGLKNGVLYYFAVCSYNAERTIQSEFSREVRARPMRSNE
ncbi:hypothetical protein FACS1894102_5250 [Spirochaetia bacterium]|nr:hypothetical protein FACS1894102_5250 [Spirochaetia bacterium]